MITLKLEDEQAATLARIIWRGCLPPNPEFEETLREVYDQMLAQGFVNNRISIPEPKPR